MLYIIVGILFMIMLVVWQSLKWHKVNGRWMYYCGHCESQCYCEADRLRKEREAEIRRDQGKSGPSD